MLTWEAFVRVPLEEKWAPKIWHKGDKIPPIPVAYSKKQVIYLDNIYICKSASIYSLIAAIWSSCAVPPLDTAMLNKGALESVSGAHNKGNNERKDERLTMALKQPNIVQNKQRQQSHLTEN